MPSVPLVEMHKKGFARMKEASPQDSSNNSLEAGPERSDLRVLSPAKNVPSYGISVKTDVEQQFEPRKSGDMEAGLDITVNVWQAPTVTSCR